MVDASELKVFFWRDESTRTAIFFFGLKILKPTSVAPRMNCRLLYLVGQLGPGGLERQLVALLEGMDRERYQPAVAVWSLRQNDEYVEQIRALGVPLYSLGSTRSNSAKLGAFRRLVRELNPEVVHSYSGWTNFAAYWATLGRQAIAIGAIRSSYPEEKQSLGPWLGPLSFGWPHSHISNSYAAAENARCAKGLFNPRQVHVVRNGLDLALFCPTSLPTQEPTQILGVGSLFPVKRWDRLLRAAAKLKGQGFNFRLRIAGDGPLKTTLERQAEGLRLKGYVEFIGHCKQIPTLLAQAAFLAHSSDLEGCPNAVMEAMACGRAVVATDVGDIPNLVEDGTSGFVVGRNDETMLAERLSNLLANRDLCRRMGEAGRRKAEREFGIQHLVSGTLAAYKAAGWNDPLNS